MRTITMQYNRLNTNNRKTEKEQTKEINKNTNKEKTTQNNTSEVELLKLYLEELKSIPPADELLKKELMQAASNGKQEARNQLAEIYLMQAVQLAATYRGRGVGLADLIQEANVGLMEALAKPNITEKQILTSIETALKQAIATERKEAELGEQIAARLNTLSDAAKDLADRHGKEPTTKELAEYLHTTEEEVQSDINLSLNLLSINDSYQQS